MTSEEFRTLVKETLAQALQESRKRPDAKAFTLTIRRINNWGQRRFRNKYLYPSQEEICEKANRQMDECQSILRCELYDLAKIPFTDDSDATIDRLLETNPTLTIQKIAILLKAEIEQFNSRRNSVKKSPAPRTNRGGIFKAKQDYDG